MHRLLAALLVVVGAGCLEPSDRRPGLRLSGETAPAVVDDWSFTDAHAEIFVETRTPYLVPHSVTIVCAVLDGRLYIGARNPRKKRWVAWVGRDPNVRLKIGERVFEQRLERVGDPAEVDAIYRAYAAKYGWEPRPAAERPEVWYFRVRDRT